MGDTSGDAMPEVVKGGHGITLQTAHLETIALVCTIAVGLREEKLKAPYPKELNKDREIYMRGGDLIVRRRSHLTLRCSGARSHVLRSAATQDLILAALEIVYDEHNPLKDLQPVWDGKLDNALLAIILASYMPLYCATLTNDRKPVRHVPNKQSLRVFM
eukprot:231281-Prymnesium_polylepis.1